MGEWYSLFASIYGPVLVKISIDSYIRKCVLLKLKQQTHKRKESSMADRRTVEAVQKRFWNRGKFFRKKKKEQRL